MNWCTKEAAEKVFAADLSKKQQGLIYATQSGASERVFGATVSAAAWKNKPSLYVVAKATKLSTRSLNVVWLKE